MTLNAGFQELLVRVIPIWSCFMWGLQCHGCCQTCGALLPNHLFTLTFFSKAVYFLLHFPCRRPFALRRRTLSGTLPTVKPGLSSIKHVHSDQPANQYTISISQLLCFWLNINAFFDKICLTFLKPAIVIRNFADV